MAQGIGGSNAADQLAEMERWNDGAPPIGVEERLARLEKARRLLGDNGADALLVGAGPSLRYFTGIGWSASERLVAMVLPRDAAPLLICPKFELGSLAAELQVDMDVQAWEEDESPSSLVADALRQHGVATLAVDPAMAYFLVDRIAKACPHLGLVDGMPVVHGCRMIKSPAELALLRQAKLMTLEVQRRAASILHTGIASLDVVRFIDEAHRALGASGSSFCIVQFGRSTAFPHGLPGIGRLKEGDVVLIDTGCTVEGYHSDITRTYAFGEPSGEQRSVWNLEWQAQQAAFEAAGPGVRCEAVDAAARQVLERAGLGPDYRLPGLPHRTGHGIGLSLHEPAYLVRGDQTLMEPGMCFSNEPMIVVPDRFGVRLEDHFFVTETGAEWFTSRSVSIDHPFD